ncbi:MAG: putative signaling protein [Herbinix sp.]|jgi:diguanylate cyclase (GGDEF)-like protein|nr:putative signaling protein [Herbinix sp.]
MRFTIPKNRTAPLILFAIFSIFVSLMMGLYHTNRMAQYSYKTKLDTYDSLTVNAAALLKQEIENNYQSLQVSANLVAKAGYLDRNKIVSLLPLLVDGKSYIDIAIVNNDGKGFNIAGDNIDVSGEDYYSKAIQGELISSNKIIYSKDNTPGIVIAAPIMENGTSKGVLLATVSAQINNLALFNTEVEEGSLVYLINENNELVSYVTGTDIKNFNYDTIIKNGILLEQQEPSLATFNLRDIFGEGNNSEKSYIWDVKPIGINNWSILIGRSYTMNPITKDILRVTNIMWVYITVATFFLFMLMIIIQRRANRKVIKMLYLDPVTGGDNWYKFRMNVNKILNSKQFTKKKFALVNFDINRFKIINDAYGYQKGDEVLKDIYYIIKKWSKISEPIARYAADQFYILLAFQDDREVTDRIHDLNDRLHQLRYTSSAKVFFGVYFITERQDSIDRMGEFAGIAKNTIKGSTEGIISFFDDFARGRLLEEEEIEKSMYGALKNNEFHVYLQPKYTAQDETISGAEALVRWINNRGSMIMPGYFIPVFEKNGFITELDYYMIRKVCELIREWLDKGYEPLPISVNVSRLHFANPHLADIIKNIVDNYDVPHHLIELELTESAFLQNKQILIETVTLLRQYGFLVSMDDFGAGYSSLNSLKDLPLDVVKLDGELFRMTDDVERGLTVIRNTITMAKDLHMKVVAECIETREQVEFLCTVGCDIIQGYYFAKPMPVDHFEERYYSSATMD